MSTDMKAAASALGAKTARACDSCLRRRARWFCGADDAFLCHSCDNLVHSANQLASRHDRVRLQTASNKVTNTARAWHSGFTRKARTPRHNNKHLALQQRLKDQVFFNNNNVLPVVPELDVEDTVMDDHDDQLLCRVPVFDPFDAELCTISFNQVSHDVKNIHAGEEDDGATCELESFSDFLSSEMDGLVDFAADVESLLGSTGIDEDSLSEMKGENNDAMVIKVKDEEELIDDDTACHLDSVFDMTSHDVFDWNIDSVLSPPEEKTAVPAEATNTVGEVGRKREMLLRLNYEDVISAWATQGCPWTTGNPPKFNSDDDTWPNFLEWSGADVQCSSYGGVRSLRGHLLGSVDGGREARVSRYREKRRTRLFAKKIRYEVRKLNAEKRPRMKGRFVKRACFVGANH